MKHGKLSFITDLFIASTLTLLVCTDTLAITKANEIITNQASAEYIDENRGVGARSISNVSTIRVRSVYRIQTEALDLRCIVPGQAFSQAFTIKNIGNIRDSYILRVNQTGSIELSDLKIINDTNGNGRADADETVINQTDRVLSGNFTQVIVQGRAPINIQQMDQGVLTLEASSTTVSGVSSSKNTTMNVCADGAQLIISKSAFPACENPIDPGSQIQYTITTTNIGNDVPPERTIRLDGVNQSGVVIGDEIPANTQYIINQNIRIEPRSIIPMIRLATSLGDNWISLGAYNGLDTIAQLGILVEPRLLSQNRTIEWIFKLQVASAITPGTLIKNRATIDFQGDGDIDVISSEACNRLKAQDANGQTLSAEVRFLEPAEPIRLACLTDPDNCTKPNFHQDDDFQLASRYRTDNGSSYNLMRDGLYLEIHSTSLNQSSFSQDIMRSEDGSPIMIQATVRSKLTGDSLQVRVVETSPNSGIFRSISPIRLSTSDTGADRACPGAMPDDLANIDFNNTLTDVCVLNSGANDQLVVEFVDADGNDTMLTDTAVVDPLGVVFNPLTLQPIIGATVSVRNPDGSLALDPDTGGATVLQPQTVGSDGFYQFPRIFPGTYYIDVIPPPGFTFPSTIPPDSFAGIFEVNQFSYGRDGFFGIVNSGFFTLMAGDPILVADIPLNPPPGIGQFTIEKNAGLARGDIGDFIPYTIRIQNTSGAVLLDAHINDQLPFGFKYEPGSAKVDGNLIDDPQGLESGSLVFNIGRLTPNQSSVLTYVAQISTGALDSDGINIAHIKAVTGGGFEVFSADAKALVLIERENLFDERSYIFGKVWLDAKCDNVQANAEWPIGGVRLYLEDGTYVITDENGQYSTYGIRPGQHVIRVDTLTLPEGLELKLLDNRNGANAKSRFVDLVDNEWHRADFAVACPCNRMAELRDELKRRNVNISDDWLLDYGEKFRQLSDNQNAQKKSFGSINQSADGDLSSGTVMGPVGKLSPQIRDWYQATFANSDKQLTVEKETIGIENTENLSSEQWLKKIDRAMAKEGRWLWPANNISRDGKFIVTIPKGITPQLLVNDKAVDSEQLGEQLVNQKEKAQLLAWYGISLNTGENLLQVKGVDPFGNERVLAEKLFIKPGQPKQLKITSSAPFLNADGGRSKLPIAIQLVDNNNIPVTGIHFITLEANDGIWLEEDVQKNQPGHQVRLVDGEGIFHLRSSYISGEVAIRASSNNDLLADLSIEFLTPMRPLMAVGLLDIQARFNTLDDSDIEPVDQDDGFDQRIDVDARSAFFLQGKVRGNMLLTVAYDSEKRSDTQLLRDIDPRAYYPIYGDASVKGFEAQSRDKLYIKLERGSRSIMWGDYRTDSSNQQIAQLGRNQFTLTGANARYESGNWSARFFAAETESRRQELEIAGNGTASNYRLSEFPIEPRSEIIELIIRDRDNPGLVISQEKLTRFGDYNLDEIDGFLTFNQAVPTQDEQGNLVFIRISFDALENNDKELVAGARIDYAMNENIKLGVTYTEDTESDDGYKLASSHVEIKALENQTLTLEAARMEHNDEKADGTALRAEYQASFLDKALTTAIQWYRAQNGFTNRGSPIQAGREELKANAVWNLNQNSKLKLEGLLSKGLESKDKRTSINASFNTRFFNAWNASMGLRFTDQDNTGDNDQLTSLRLRLGRGFEVATKPGKMYVEYEQDLGNSSRKGVQLGGELQVHEKIRAYGRYEFINSLSGITNLSSDNEKINSVIGLESSYLPSTNSYSEYRLRGGIDGRELETANGIRSTFELKPGITLSPQFEYIKTNNGPDDSDSMALSLAYADRASKNKRTSLRVETRQNDQSDFYGVIGSYTSRINLDWSSLIREDFSLELSDDQGRKLRHALTVGLARRPRLDNQHHLLFAYRWEEERNQGIDESTLHLLSTHHNYQLNEAMILSGFLALKYRQSQIEGDEFDSTTWALGSRFIWDISRRFDVDVHGGVLGVDGTDSLRYSLGLGVNFLLNRNVRIGVGYNFAGFDDDDLEDQTYNAQGLYVGFQWKVDEQLFRWLSPDQDDLTVE